MSKKSEEENLKIYRYIRTCHYANSLDIKQLYEIRNSGNMPKYPKFVEQNELEEFYSSEDRDEEKLLDCRASSTDIMAIENIIRKKFKENLEASVEK